MKKRIVGIIVLVLIGVLVPVVLSQCMHGGDTDDGSMRVYEITPDGNAQPADSGAEDAAPEAAEAEPDGTTDVPETGEGQAQEETESSERPEPISPDSTPQAPSAGEQQEDEVSTEPSRETDDAAGAQPSGDLRRSGQAEGWVVQVASFGDEANAERLAQQLSSDYDAFYRAGDVNGKTYYRVRVGPFDNEAEARETATRLRRAGRTTLVQQAG